MAILKPKYLHKFIKPYVIKNGEKFRLKDHNPADTHDLSSAEKPEAKKMLEEGVAMLSAMQQVLYAQGHWALLVVIQAMDAAGKDSTIKHVMSGVNPQGVDVFAFKSPSAEELAHDFLWRTMRCLPPRGKIGIFNRSYFEEVLVARVHPEVLDRQGIPKELRGKHFWRNRYEDINAFERYLARNGIAILKFFLNVSKKEQKRRFLERLDDPRKSWKFSAADVNERQHWNAYQDAYEEMIRNTSTEDAPWTVVPADNKWFSRLLVVAAMVDKLQRLDLRYPRESATQRKELEQARKLLRKE